MAAVEWLADGDGDEDETAEKKEEEEELERAVAGEPPAAAGVTAWRMPQLGQKTWFGFCERSNLQFGQACAGSALAETERDWRAAAEPSVLWPQPAQKRAPGFSSFLQWVQVWPI